MHGLARRLVVMNGVHPVSADLTDRGNTEPALRDLRPDAVFIATSLRQPTEAENVRVYGAMVRNLLGALRAPAEIANRHGLLEPDPARVASPWHTDADLGRLIEVVTDMGKSRRLGFLDDQPTDDAFFDLFTPLRAERIIP